MWQISHLDLKAIYISDSFEINYITKCKITYRLCKIRVYNREFLCIKILLYKFISMKISLNSVNSSYHANGHTICCMLYAICRKELIGAKVSFEITFVGRKFWFLWNSHKVSYHFFRIIGFSVFKLRRRFSIHFYYLFWMIVQNLSLILNKLHCSLLPNSTRC